MWSTVSGHVQPERWPAGAAATTPSSNGDRPDRATVPTTSRRRRRLGNNNRPRGQGPNQGPPDLDELWRDFNRKLGGLFGGGRGGGNGGRPNGGNGGGGFQPDMKSAGVGLGLIAAVVVLIWLGSGFFIVQEGQQAVVTPFGRYKATVGAGFNWRLPYPIQRTRSSSSRRCAPSKSAATPSCARPACATRRC